MGDISNIHKMQESLGMDIYEEGTAVERMHRELLARKEQVKEDRELEESKLEEVNSANKGKKPTPKEFSEQNREKQRLRASINQLEKRESEMEKEVQGMMDHLEHDRTALHQDLMDHHK